MPMLRPFLSAALAGAAIALGAASLAWPDTAGAAGGAPAAATPDLRALMTRAQARIDAKQWQPAILDLEQIAQREPRNADAHNLLGFAWRNLGQYERSRGHYLEALRLDPGHKAAHEYLGELYVKTGQVDEARKLLASLEKLCGGRTCEEYVDLDKAIAGAGQ